MIQFDDHIFQMGWNHQPVIWSIWSLLSQESSIGRFFYYRDRTDLVPQDLRSIATPGILKETHLLQDFVGKIFHISPYYCWWKKSCTSWYVVSPIIYKVLYIPGGAEFLPSTVSYPHHLFLLGKNPSLLVEKIFVPPGHLSQETRITFAGFDEPNILGSYGLVAWTRCGDWWRSLDTQNLPLLGFTNEEIQLFFWDVSFDWIFWITTASKRSAFSKSRCKVRVLKANNSEKDANTMLHHCLKTK